MRYYYFIPALASIIFTACTNKNEDNHTHDDQATHEHGTMDHIHAEGNLKQEEFTIDSNDQTTKQEQTNHNHEDGSHQHEYKVKIE